MDTRSPAKLISKNQLSSDTLRYLTGAMNGEEREAFETRLLMDHDFSDAVAVCEQDILDSYVSGGLDPEETFALQSWIEATPARIERVRMARALLRKKPTGIGRGRHLVAVLLAAAACVMVGLGVTFRLLNKSASQSKAAVPFTVSPIERSTNGRPAVSGNAQKTEVILLVAERLRGEPRVPAFRMDAGVPIELQVLLNGRVARRTYGLKIVSSDARQRVVVERNDLSVQEKDGHPFLDITLPAESLPPATYDVFVGDSDDRLFSRFSIR
jgi:anti-sigma factor RsiW